MHIPLALLWVLVVAAPGCTGLPTMEESMRNNIPVIVKIAKITMVHIGTLTKRLPVSTPIESDVPSIEGLTSISRDLGLLGNELQCPFTGLLSQIQADVSSMEGRVRSLALAMGCSLPAKQPSEPCDDEFPDSHVHLALRKAQVYLEMFLLNENQLRVC